MFMQKLAILLPFLACHASGQNVHQILSSGYSKGFYNLSFNGDTGAIEPNYPILVSGSEIDANMSWAAFDSRSGNLYAIHEGPGPDEDIVSWWTIAWDMENIVNMTRVQAATVKGFGPAHVALSPTFPVLFVSNYGSGSVVVYSTVGGPEMKGPIYFEEFKRGSGVVPDRQGAAHAHGAFFFGDNAYVTDLGGDAIWHYKITMDPDFDSVFVDKGPSHYAASPGFGPRHMAIDQPRNRAYVMNELSRHISVLNVGDEGTLSLAKEIPYHVEGAMEDDVQNGAEITLAADGKTLYASVRNYNRTGAMLVFSVHDDSPYLSQIQSIPTSGQVPRFFAVVDRHILVPDQVNSLIDVFRIEPENAGRLNLVGQSLGGQMPTCLVAVT